MDNQHSPADDNTNMYYSHYASCSESDVYYDSDSKETWNKMIHLPETASFCHAVIRRNTEAMIFEKWVKEIRYKIDIKELERKCGMKVKLYNEKIKYIYISRINEKHMQEYKYHITFRYEKNLRKWYFSAGYSFLPDCLILPTVEETYTYNPVSKRVLKFVKNLRKDIDISLERMLILQDFFNSSRRSYPDIEFQIDVNMDEKLTIILKESACPKFIKKFNLGDKIILVLLLNKDHVVRGILECNYIPYKLNYLNAYDICLKKVKQIFTKRSISNGFYKFMNMKTFEEGIES